MTDSVSFKAYLKRDGQEVEVRRFGIDGGAATSYMYLRSKIQAMFPIIPNDQFQVFWQDNDKDYIRVDSDEELLEALTLSNQQPLKIYIRVENTSNSQGGPTGSSSGSGGQHQHSGVVCDGCEGAVTGFRYKCVTCPDYDLCSRCESNGLHTEHFMLRMPTPVNHFQHHPKFLRKMFSHPHKFHKRHGWSRPSPPPRGCGDSQNGPRRCPFSRQGEAPGISFAGLPDMFDFSALMEFIESLSSGVEDPSNQGTSAATAPGVAPTATASNAFQNSQAPSSSQNQAQEPSRPQHERSSATTYLNNIGQMVAAILDPLGVDVTFDVRTKPSQDQQPQTSAASPPPTVPSPTVTPPTVPSPTVTPPTVPSPTVIPPNVPCSYFTIPSSSVPLATTPQATPVPTTTPVAKPDVPSTSSQTETIPAATIETQTEPARERRNSDDWTILNRESPVRNEMIAMDVDESQGTKAKTPPPPAAQDTPAPSAPPNTDDLTDAERRRIEEAIATFRSMGFDHNTQNLREMLRIQNCDMISVLEMMLNAKKK